MLGRMFMRDQGIYRTIGRRLRARRRLLEMTQRDVGTRCGLTFQQIQKYEAGAGGGGDTSRVCLPRRRSGPRRTLAPQSAPGIYASTYTPERGAAICRRLAAGESLRAICRADPAMPTEKTVWNWARAHETEG